MGDLISRSALLQEVKSLRVTVMGLRAGKGVLHEYAKQYRDTLLRIINEQPAIEAVPVVERNKIIDEFAEMCKADIMCQTFGLHPINIDKIAEQMKGGTK